MKKETRIARRKYIQVQFDYVFIESMKKIYSETFDNIMFEIDTDLGKSFSRVGLKHKNPDFTYEIADVVAYCNTKNKIVSQVLEENISKCLKALLCRRLDI